MPTHFFVFFLSSCYFIGFYDPFRRTFNRLAGRSATEQIAATSVAAGAASGIVGGDLIYSSGRY